MRRDDAGNAALEFLTLGVLLLVPLLYLVVTVGRVQAASMAADGAASLGARALSSADDERTGRRAAAGALELGLRDHGLTDVRHELDVTCSAAACLTPGARVQVTVTLEVPLPVVPQFLGPPAVTVRAHQTAVVDQYRAAGAR
ncbi:pilus assembly protein [Spongisporangium articulatum]|uniref:Pilus assembly protein n=1 Tax=Spongisporangium articulatum TaxID=3362603 RepID=A0ABW8AK17_9ACTN